MGAKQKKPLLYLTYQRLKEIFHRTGVKPKNFILPLFLGLLAAGFEAISAALLIPLAQAVITMDFTSLRVPFLTSLTFLKPFQKFIDNGVLAFGLIVAVVFLAALLKNVIQYLSSLSIAHQLRRFSNSLRQVIFDRYLSFGKLFFDRTNAGHLKYILTGGNGLIIEELMHLHAIFSTAFMFIVYLTIMFAISWKLTLLCIAVFPILNFSIRWLIIKIQQTSTPYIKAQFTLVDLLNNILSCLPLVKAYSREEREKQNFNKSSNLLQEWEFSMDKKTQLTEPFQEIIVHIAVLIILLLMAFMVVRGEAHRLSSFLVYFYILRRAERGFAIPNKIKALLARISGPAEELADIFSDKDKFFVPGGDKLFKGLKESIDFRNLSFSYIPQKIVLNNITFSIKKGEMTAIVGPSGAGKSTIINLIMRFYDCPVSRIFVDSEDIRNFKLESLRRHIALVSQDTLLFNDTLKANITYGFDQDLDEEVLITAAKKARLYDFIMALPDKFNTRIGDRGVQLSGGEKQRVSIMRALLKNAEILILDEATSSLDSRIERLIQEAIEEVIKGRTTLVIAHRLSTIRNTNKILVIEEGKLVEEGTLEGLLNKKGKFYQYWQEQKFY
ncbi:MAG: ABC transporter ATP-binding protein [Candidatus Omnitrophica bacterium]|jgi:subfamily B ATP-binding cassette protein MsbA|nr:ABC transporter ATP-binding protein [Candidatus Omnitrophota bacterium]